MVKNNNNNKGNNNSSNSLDFGRWPQTKIRRQKSLQCCFVTICGRLGKEKERKKPQAQETRKKFNLNEQNGTLTFFIVLNRSFIKKY